MRVKHDSSACGSLDHGKQGGTAVIIPSLFRGGFFMLKKGE